jgi:hypothetical protein
MADTSSRDSNLPFNPGTLSRLLLAAQADGEAAFCDELRVYRGDDLMLRWAQPVSGALRIAATVPEQRIWRFASLAVATYKRARGSL